MGIQQSQPSRLSDNPWREASVQRREELPKPMAAAGIERRFDSGNMRAMGLSQEESRALRSQVQTIKRESRLGRQAYRDAIRSGDKAKAWEIVSQMGVRGQTTGGIEQSGALERTVYDRILKKRDDNAARVAAQGGPIQATPSNGSALIGGSPNIERFRQDLDRSKLIQSGDEGALQRAAQRGSTLGLSSGDITGYLDAQRASQPTSFVNKTAQGSVVQPQGGTPIPSDQAQGVGGLLGRLSEGVRGLIGSISGSIGSNQPNSFESLTTPEISQGLLPDQSMVNQETVPMVDSLAQEAQNLVSAIRGNLGPLGEMSGGLSAYPVPFAQNASATTSGLDQPNKPFGLSPQAQLSPTGSVLPSLPTKATSDDKPAAPATQQVTNDASLEQKLSGASDNYLLSAAFSGLGGLASLASSISGSVNEFLVPSNANEIAARNAKLRASEYESEAKAARAKAEELSKSSDPLSRTRAKSYLRDSLIAKGRADVFTERSLQNFGKNTTQDGSKSAPSAPAPNATGLSSKAPVAAPARLPIPGVNPNALEDKIPLRQQNVSADYEVDSSITPPPPNLEKVDLTGPIEEPGNPETKQFKSSVADWMVSGTEKVGPKIKEAFSSAVESFGKAAKKGFAAVSVTPQNSAGSKAIPMEEIMAGPPKSAQGGLHKKPGLAMPTTQTGANFGSEKPSEHAKSTADWVVGSQDHGDKPFAIADKKSGKMHFFGKDGKLIESVPALFGRVPGDDGGKHQTASGRYDASIYKSQDYDGDTIEFDRAKNQSGGVNRQLIHRVPFSSLTATPKQRYAALSSSDPGDNRQTSGCINLDPKASKRLTPHFKGGGVVYVMPETEQGAKKFEGFSGLKFDSPTAKR